MNTSFQQLRYGLFNMYMAEYDHIDILSSSWTFDKVQLFLSRLSGILIYWIQVLADVISNWISY